MRIEKFVDQITALAEGYGVTTAALLGSVDPHEHERWIAFDGPRAVGAATVWEGPDLRARLALHCRGYEAYQPLIRAVLSQTSRPLYARVDGSDVSQRKALTANGFTIDYSSDVYRVPFAGARDYLHGTVIPSGFSLRTADRLDRSRWFTLDNNLRQDVKGNEGWRGDLRQFARDNYESPRFAPEAYLIAVEDANGEYAGLVRFWSGDVPRLGLVAVLRQYRGIGLGKALLASGVLAAAAWDRPAFEGESHRGNTVMRTLWIRMGASDTGSVHSLIHRG